MSNITFTELDLRDARALGAKLPREIIAAEEVQAAVRAKVNEKPADLAIKLRTAKPADVPAILDEFGTQVATANAIKSSGAVNAADGRLVSAWENAKAGVLDGLISGLTGKVAEINRLALLVPAGVAADMNSSTDPEALASAAKLKVLLADVQKVATFAAATISDGAAAQHVQAGKVEMDLIKLTDIEPEFEGFYAKQQVLKHGNDYTPVLSPSGVVALAGAGVKLTVHSLQEQVARAVKLYQSRQGFEVTGGKALPVSKESQAFKRATDATYPIH